MCNVAKSTPLVLLQLHLILLNISVFQAGCECLTSMVRIGDDISSTTIASVNFYDGRFEVYYDGEWGTVCSKPGISDTAFSLACRQMGFTGGSQSSDFTDGTGAITVRGGLCDDNATTNGRIFLYEDCEFLFPWGDTGVCTHTDDVGIECYGSNTYNDPGCMSTCYGQAHLPNVSFAFNSNYNYIVTSRLQVNASYSNTNFYDLCYDQDSGGSLLSMDEIANLACIDMGYEYGELTTTNSNDDTSDYQLISCDSHDTSLCQCTISTVTTQTCTAGNAFEEITCYGSRFEDHGLCTASCEETPVTTQATTVITATTATTTSSNTQESTIIMNDESESNGDCSNGYYINGAVNLDRNGDGSSITYYIGSEQSDSITDYSSYYDSIDNYDYSAVYSSYISIYSSDLNEWIYICDESVYWTDFHANITCQQMGYAFGEKADSSVSISSTSSYYVNSVECDGTETQIRDCTFTSVSYQTSCSQMAGLYCYGWKMPLDSNSTDCNNPDDTDTGHWNNNCEYALRLMDYRQGTVGQYVDDYIYNIGGRLEIYYNGQWGVIGENTTDSTVFTDTNAQVACEQLGFTFGDYHVNLPVTAPDADTHIYMQNVRCTGTESYFKECTADVAFETDNSEYSCNLANSIAITCYSNDYYPGNSNVLYNNYCNNIDTQSSTQSDTQTGQSGQNSTGTSGTTPGPGNSGEDGNSGDSGNSGDTGDSGSTGGGVGTVDNEDDSDDSGDSSNEGVSGVIDGLLSEWYMWAIIGVVVLFIVLCVCILCRNNRKIRKETNGNNSRHHESVPSATPGAVTAGSPENPLNMLSNKAKNATRDTVLLQNTLQSDAVDTNPNGSGVQLISNNNNNINIAGNNYNAFLDNNQMQMQPNIQQIPSVPSVGIQGIQPIQLPVAPTVPAAMQATPGMLDNMQGMSGTEDVEVQRALKAQMQAHMQVSYDQHVHSQMQLTAGKLDGENSPVGEGGAGGETNRLVCVLHVCMNGELIGGGGNMPHLPSYDELNR